MIWDALSCVSVFVSAQEKCSENMQTLENGKTLVEGKGENAYSSTFVEWFGWSPLSLPGTCPDTSPAEEAVRTYGGR